MSNGKTATIEFPTIQEVEYQFICHYSDGSKLVQDYGTPHERTFKHIDQDKLEVFELTNGQKSFKLNLKTGDFDLNGLIIRFKDRDIPDAKRSFYTPDEDWNDKPEPQLRLIYFRRIRVDFAPTGQVNTVRHVIGWQTTVDGKNIQRLVMVERDGSLTMMNGK